jgi:hypothetical protein
MNITKNFNSNLKDEWIYEYIWCESGSYTLDVIKKTLRLINLLILFPIVIFTKNSFEIVHIFGNTSKKKCLVCTKNNARVLNILRNTLKGFQVSDMKIQRRVCWPNLKRAFIITYQSLSHANYSLYKMDEIYDFDCHKDLVRGFDFFASSDGATPLARKMCHAFNSIDKCTLRIMPQVNKVNYDYNYNYNFVTESYRGEIGDGWTMVKGSPWNKASHERNRERVIGVIGGPNGVRIFGLEYWMLIFAYKIQKNNHKVKIRLHPQSYKFSNYLIKKIYNIDTSVDESDSDFIASCTCLISSYRSSLVDLALDSGVIVILDGQKNLFSTKNSNHDIEFISLRNCDKKTIKYIGLKAYNHSFIIQPHKDIYPSIRDVVSQVF